MAEKKIKRRNSVVLKLYKIFFIAVFIAWIIFAFKRCFPYSPFYNFDSPAPASYESYEEYIDYLKNYKEKCDKQDQRQNWLRNYYQIKETFTRYKPCIYNIQVDGVNEGDVIKNDGKYLYILSEEPYMRLETYPHTLMEGTVTIMEAYPPYEMNEVYNIELVSGNTEGVNRKYKNILISGQNLIILSVEYDSYYYGNSYSVFTCADIYDITAPTKPVYKRTFKLDGYLISSREKDGILYIFAGKSILWDDKYYYDDSDSYIKQSELADNDRFIPSYYDTNYGEKHYISPDNLHTYLPKVTKDNYNNSLATFNIAAIDLNGNTPAEVSSYTFGNNSSYFPITLYMSAENKIYLMQPKQEDGKDYTDILKLSVDKTDVKYIASRKLPGNTGYQCWDHEYKGNSRIITYWNKGYHLFILDENLNYLSSVMYIAGSAYVNILEMDSYMEIMCRDYIKSVRFDGDICYIVTSVNIDTTDYLLIFDLSDPKSPIITEKRKIHK